MAKMIKPAASSAIANNNRKAIAGCPEPKMNRATR